MKILSITLRNLASIEGTSHIDFTAGPLATTGIYAISGSTGAGKSTILDALCLALYDCTPRFAVPGENLYLQDVGDNQIHQNDVRNILRRGSGEGFAEVVFVGVDGHPYKSRWSVNRAKNDPTGPLMPQSIEVTSLQTGEEYTGTKDELLGRLVRLTGLSYEQFTRTVLLAQNDFATFLKSSEAQKAELLEKLTGTEIYSQISRAIYVKNRSVHSEINFLKQTIKQLEIISDEELQKMAVERNNLVPKRDYANRQLLVLNEQLRIVTVFKQQQALLEEKKKEHAAIKETFDNLLQQKAKHQEDYKAFRQYTESLQPELEQAAALDLKIQNSSEKQKTQNEVCISISERRINMAKSLADKELLFANELDWVNNEKSEPSNQKLIELHKQVGKEKQILDKLRSENEERLIQLNKYGIGKLAAEQDTIVKELKHLQEARMTMLSRIGLQKEHQRLTGELNENRLLAEQQEKDIQLLEEQLERKLDKVKTLEKLYDSARITMSRDVKELRDHLATDEPCPVCGSISHPYKHQDHISDSLYSSIEQEYKSHLDDYQQAKNKILIINRDIQKLYEFCEMLSSRIKSIEEEMKTVTLPSGEELSIKDIGRKFIQLSETQKKLIVQMNRYQAFYDEWYSVEQQIKKQRTVHDSLKDSLSFCQLLLQDVNAEKEQLSSVSSIEMEEKSRLAAISQELDILRKEREKLLDGKIISDVQATLQLQQNEIMQQTEITTKELDKCNSSLLILDGEIRQLSITVKALEMEHQSIENADDLPGVISHQKELIEEMDRRNAYIENKLLQQQDNRITYRKLESDIEKKQKIASKWEKLNWIIGSSDGGKFKIIAQSYTLNLLLLHANRHLNYLSSRYRLQQVPDTLALQVIDHEMCNEVRTIHSLSGGESFLISLALALGLSSLSSNNLKVESLFIDEGFGSLDNESLNTAMKALEQLYVQGRKIGVISHIQEMTERIPVKIHVEKTVNGKSRIEIIA